MKQQCGEENHFYMTKRKNKVVFVHNFIFDQKTGLSSSTMIEKHAFYLSFIWLLFT